MKHLWTVLFLLTLSPFFPFSSHAASYTDPLSTVLSDSVRSCVGLRVSELSSRPAGSYLTFQNPSSTSGGVFGSVTYQVTGVQEIVVDLYTHIGSFYMENMVDYGFTQLSGTMLGFQHIGQTAWSTARPMIGKAPDGRYALYANTGGGLAKMYYHRLDYILSYPRVFYTVAEQEPTDRRPYALEVWASDGSIRTAVEMTRVSAEWFPAQNYCREQFRGTVTQSGIREIQVAINDVCVIPYSDLSGVGETINPTQLTALAGVTLTGDQLVLGPVEDPRPPEEDPVPDSSSSRRPSAGRAAGSVAPEDPSEALPSTPASSSSSSSSSASKKEELPKFEGSAILPGRSESAKPSSQSSAEKKTPPSELPSPEAESVPQPIVYRPTAQPVGRSDPFGVAIIAYLVAAAAAILLVVLRSMKR